MIITLITTSLNNTAKAFYRIS